MEKRWGIWAFAVVSTFYILFSVGPAFAVTVPEKLNDIPLFQGSKVQQAMDMENHAMLSATVKAKVDAIADFYKNAMQGKGWKVAFQAEQEDMKIIQFKKDKQLLQVTIQLEKGAEEATYNLLMTSQ
jgi:hypothetical protein